MSQNIKMSLEFIRQLLVKNELFYFCKMNVRRFIDTFCRLDLSGMWTGFLSKTVDEGSHGCASARVLWMEKKTPEREITWKSFDRTDRFIRYNHLFIFKRTIQLWSLVVVVSCIGCKLESKEESRRSRRFGKTFLWRKEEISAQIIWEAMHKHNTTQLERERQSTGRKNIGFFELIADKNRFNSLETWCSERKYTIEKREK